MKFPQHAEKDMEGKDSISVIRLLTRLIFVWFMKEKGLIPSLLFEKNRITEYLKDLSDNKSTYYKAVLQNLFFATLNTPVKERKFRTEERYNKGYNEDFGNHYVYRYNSLFNPEKDWKELFVNIPFLNGGIFDCLDKKKDPERKYIDGFSDTEKNQPDVPDVLFFGLKKQDKEYRMNLNKVYSTSNKKYELSGIINILDSYKFTITENTPLEEEIALEPNLLGIVFESLLAYYNPETGLNARKQQGSYYTPREIVDYMVNESLIEYLQNCLEKTCGVSKTPQVSPDKTCGVSKTQQVSPDKTFGVSKTPQVSPDKTFGVSKTPQVSEETNKKLRNLFDYKNNENPFDSEETKILIKALSNMKILDPACGSGAFPMGILDKTVYLLSKIDKDNTLWEIQQLANTDEQFGLLLKQVEADIKTAKQIKIEDIREQTLFQLEERKKQIRGEFAKNIQQPNFTRKLYLIRDCIYGVDIQHIAVLICKLRFFISLLVDTAVFKDRENWGIEPLPNLDYKIMQGNSLLGIKEELFNQDKILKAEKLKSDYFVETDHVKKEKLQKEIESLMNELAEGKGKFDYKLYFSEVFRDKNGFDIVIGNPPYGADLKKEIINLLVSDYKYYDRQKNSASFFVELATKIIRKNGVITYIIPKSISFSEGWKKTRELITEQNQLQILIDVSKAFEAVLLEQVIVLYLNNKSESYEFYVGENWNSEIKIIGELQNNLIKELDILPIYVDSEKLNILKRLKQGSILLSEISDTFRGLPFQSKISKKGEPILRGKNIAKYQVYRDIDTIELTEEIKNNKKIQAVFKPKIISQRIVAHVLKPRDRIIIMATVDKKPYLTLDTVMNTIINKNNFKMEYIVSLLNSKLAEWFYYWFVYNRAVRTMDFDKYYIGKLPVKKISLNDQQPFITLVDRILKAKEKNPKADTSEMEKQIDSLVYELYGLTEEEIKIVKGEK